MTQLYRGRPYSAMKPVEVSMMDAQYRGYPFRPQAHATVIQKDIHFFGRSAAFTPIH